MYSVQTGLIESDWNLKWLCQGLLCLHLQGINRIRLEFKEIIVKGDPAVFVRINRIRLEFKGNDVIFMMAFVCVLIESDWNLKPFRRILTSTIASVLIKSDWNLKFCRSSALLLEQRQY